MRPRDGYLDELLLCRTTSLEVILDRVLRLWFRLWLRFGLWVRFRLRLREFGVTHRGDFWNRPLYNRRGFFLLGRWGVGHVLVLLSTTV
jgi:hypothetical protein